MVCLHVYTYLWHLPCLLDCCISMEHLGITSTEHYGDTIFVLSVYLWQLKSYRTFVKWFYADMALLHAKSKETRRFSPFRPSGSGLYGVLKMFSEPRSCQHHHDWCQERPEQTALQALFSPWQWYWWWEDATAVALVLVRTRNHKQIYK
jgi:hypothetical protein